MFIELVDVLRCPHPHDPSWLVLGAERMDGRDVVEGVLGCPVCRAQFRIAGGIADLRAAPASAPVAGPPAAEAETDQAVRLAAFLGLAEPGGFAVLVGAWTAQAAALGAVADAHLLLVNPVAGAPIGGATSGILVGDGLPIAAASARALAVDEGAGGPFLARAVAAVRAGGRVVAPAGAPVPDGVRELARDRALWVGERDAEPGGLVSLARGGR